MPRLTPTGSRRSDDCAWRAPVAIPTRPLADVRVVDFGVGGVGPFAATLLAWLGADVVKVEAPERVHPRRAPDGRRAEHHLSRAEPGQTIRSARSEGRGGSRARSWARRRCGRRHRELPPRRACAHRLRIRRADRAQPATRLLLRHGLRRRRPARRRAVHGPAHAGVQWLRDGERRRGRPPAGGFATTASSTWSRRRSPRRPSAPRS